MKSQSYDKLSISLDTIDSLKELVKERSTALLIGVAVKDMRQELRRAEYDEICDRYPPEQEEYEIACGIEGLTPQKVF